MMPSAKNNLSSVNPSGSKQSSNSRVWSWPYFVCLMFSLAFKAITLPKWCHQQSACVQMLKKKNVDGCKRITLLIFIFSFQMAWSHITVCKVCQLILPSFRPSVLRLRIQPEDIPDWTHSKSESQSSVEIKFGGNSVTVCPLIGHVVTNLFSQLLNMKPSCTDRPSDGIARSSVGTFMYPCSQYCSFPFECVLVNCCNIISLKHLLSLKSLIL